MAKRKVKRATQKDVAERAGVTVPTVSYILRKVEPNCSRYTEKTIKRVQRIAKELGYIPNLLATSLRDQQLPFFGVFFEFVRAKDVSRTGGLPAVMWEVYEGIANTAAESDRYPVLLASPGTHVSLADKPDVLDRVVRSGLSGVIAAVYDKTWKNHLDQWEELGIPCISLFHPGTQTKPRWYVDLDNQGVGRQAWEYLFQRGHRRVLCPMGKKPTQAARERIDAFTSAQEESGVKPHVLKLSCWNEVEDQYVPEAETLVTEAMRKTKATAIFGSSGAMTNIAFTGLHRHGIKMPDDCSLIGIDVLEFNEAYSSTTQYVCPGVEVGKAAAELLKLRINDNPDHPQHILVPPVLRVRTSVA